MNKSHILAEIRRLAIENGGKPPGSRQFYSSTNTRDSVWKNKAWNDWNNWGDVLEEAGFPRRAQTTKFDPSQVLRQIALLTRKLGRFPITLDMRREKRINADFPNDKTISDAFGGREKVLQALIDFCAVEQHFADILPMLSGTSITVGFKKSPRQDEDDDGTDVETGDTGYVYLFKSHRQYKIGSSRAPYRRVSELINQSAFGGKPIHIISTDDPEGIEDYWHRRFESSRIKGDNKASGEWFLLSPTDVAAFKRRKTM